MPLPFSTKEHEEIPDSVYENIREKFEGQKERKKYGV
jgi:hypothetical protein